MTDRLSDEDRALQAALGAERPPSQRKSDDAFARSVSLAVRERRERKGLLTFGTPLLAGAGALASVALFVALLSAPPAPGVSADELLAGSLAALDEAEPTYVDALPDAALLTLSSDDAYLGLATGDEDDDAAFDDTAAFDDAEDGSDGDADVDEGDLWLADSATTSALEDDELLAFASALDEALSL